MAKEDPLKARVVYAVAGQAFECKFITTIESWDALVDAIEDVSVIWVHVDAKVDDIDGNKFCAGILRDSIGSYDYITVNGL